MPRRRRTFDPHQVHEVGEFLAFIKRKSDHTAKERRELDPSFTSHEAFAQSARNYLFRNDIPEVEDINELILDYLRDIDGIPPSEPVSELYELCTSICEMMLRAEEPLRLYGRVLADGMLEAEAAVQVVTLPTGEDLARTILDENFTIFVEASVDYDPYFYYNDGTKTYFGRFVFATE